MSLQDLIQKFKEPGGQKFTRGDVKVVLGKLMYFQRGYIGRLATSSETNSEYIEEVKKAIDERPDIDLIRRDWPQILGGRDETEYLTRLFPADGNNFTTTAAWVERLKYLFIHPTKEALIESLPKLVSYKHRTPTVENNVTVTEIMESIEKSSFMNEAQDMPEKPFQDDHFKTEIYDKGRGGKFNAYLRWALMAGGTGPSNFATMELLGLEESKRRLVLAAEVIRSGLVELEGNDEMVVEAKEDEVAGEERVIVEGIGKDLERDIVEKEVEAEAKEGEMAEKK